MPSRPAVRPFEPGDLPALRRIRAAAFAPVVASFRVPFRVRRIAAFALAAAGLASLTPVPAGAQPADPARGLWIGPIHACRDTAESNVAAKGDDAFASLIITLRPQLRGRLQRETKRRVGRLMPIRLDGKLISAPIVHEPITGGALSLAGASRDETNTIRAAIRRPC